MTIGGAGLVNRVRDAIAAHASKSSQRVQVGRVLAHDVRDADSEHGKRNRDEGSVRGAITESPEPSLGHAPESESIRVLT